MYANVGYMFYSLQGLFVDWYKNTYTDFLKLGTKNKNKVKIKE